MLLALKSYLQLLAHVLLLCVGCRVMSLIIVKLKLQMCKFRKGVLVFKIEYHVYIFIVKQPDYIPILYIFRYRKPQSFGDKVSNYSSRHLMQWSFFITHRNDLQIRNIS